VARIRVQRWAVSREEAVIRKNRDEFMNYTVRVSIRAIIHVFFLLAFRANFKTVTGYQIIIIQSFLFFLCF
jgi:hypothetical protein